MLSELIEILSPILPTETSVFKGEKCTTYAVLTPIVDKLELYTDDLPTAEIIEVRISIYCKGNYQEIKNKITQTLLKNEITITDRRYLGHEDDTDYHHYAIDTMKNYTFIKEE